MRSLLSLVISLNLIISPFAMAIERENLVGIDETTENFQDTSNGGGGNSGTSRTSGSGGVSGRTSNPGTSRGSTSSGSTTSTAQKRQCAPGEIYNSFSEKCMGSEESRILNAEADQECNVLTDPQLRASCVNSRVTEKTTRAEENGDMEKHSDGVSKISLLPILLAFTTLYAAIDHLATRGPGCPGAISSYLMIGGSVAIIATEIMTKTTFTKDLKKSQKELEAIVKGASGKDSDNKNATDLQAQIFEALIKRENGVINAAEGKKKGYNIAKLLFASATISAGFEIAKYISMKAATVTAAAAVTMFICKDATASIKNQDDETMYAYLNYLEKYGTRLKFHEFQKNLIATNIDSLADFQAVSIDQYRFLNGNFDSVSLNEYAEIKVKHAKSSSQNMLLTQAFNLIRSITIPDANAAAIVKMKVAEVKGFKKFFITPFSRLVLAGLMTGVTITLTGHADKEIQKANKRIEVLEKLKSQVTEAGPAVKCANGTEQGKEGCKQVVPTTIKPGDSTFGLARTQANGAANTNRSSAFAAKGCAAKNGQADPECGCKKSNSCFSMNSNFNIGNTPAGNILGTGVSDLNALTSGELSPSNLNSEAMGKQLAAAAKMRDKMLSDLNKDPKLAAEIKKAQEAMNGLQRQMFNSMPANASSAGAGIALSNDSDLSGLSGNQILEQVKEELKEASAPKVTNEAVAGSGESEFNFDIGTADPMNVGTGVTEGEGNANTNIDDFELAESEINPSSTTNIFEILSSRYKKSAYMRLLKSDKEIAPEAPAEKEIND